MADSSSKEAMRALAVFLGAYMQGKQADKERAAKDHWEQVHYDLAKQQLQQSEMNASADRAMRQASQDFEAKKYAEQQAVINQDRAQLDTFAQQNNFPNYNAMDAALKKQQIDADVAAMAARNDPEAKKRDDLLQWDARLNAEEALLSRQLNEVYELAKDPMTGQINAAVLEDPKVKAQLDPIRQRLAVLAQDRGQLTEMTRRMMGVADRPVITPDPGVGKGKGGGDLLEKTKKASQKSTDSAWPKDATGKPKRMEEMNWFEPPAAVIGAAVDPLMKGAAKMDKAANTAAKGFMAGFGHQTGTPFNSPLPGGGTMLNTGINPKKLKEYLGKAGATKQPKNLFEGIWDSLNGQ